MTSRQHPGGTHDFPYEPLLGRPHPAAADRSAPGETPAPEDAPASPASATGPRRGRLASTLIAGAVAGALAAAPTTLLLERADAPVPSATAAPAAVEPTLVTAPESSGVDVGAILDAARPGVVAIHTEVVSRTSTGVQRGQAAGSGFVLDAEGTIVTNSHVVNGAHAITVELVDGSELDAVLLAQDPTRDLAVLSVDGGDLAALEIGDSRALGVGDPVVAIGNALGLEGDLTVTTGIVSAKDRDVPVADGGTLRGLLQTDAAINPGNSGGPLVDREGRVVGINTAGALGAQSIGFAIPINDAMPILESLAAGEVPAQPFLGVQTVDLDNAIRAEAGIERKDGALVVSVTPGSAAENGGVRPGDVVTSVAGEAVEQSSDLGRLISGLEPGASVELQVDRGGEVHAVTVTLGSRPGSVA